MATDPDEPELDLELDDGQEDDEGLESHEDGGEDAEGDERVDAKSEEGNDDEEGQAREVRPAKGRATNRISALRNENRQLAEQQAKLQRELEDIRRDRQTVREDPALEQQRLALMTPEERIEYRFQQSEQRHQQQLRQIQRTTAEAADRNNFALLTASNPTAKRYESKVETLFQQEFAKGNFVDRRTIFRYVLGEAMEQKLASGSGKQKQQAARRVQQQQTRPANGRGDVSTSRRGGQSLEDKLSDVII